MVSYRLDKVMDISMFILQLIYTTDNSQKDDNFYNWKLLPSSISHHKCPMGVMSITQSQPRKDPWVQPCITARYRTPPINAQCRSMPINVDQNSGIDPNVDQFLSMPINSDQLIGIERNWSELIGNDRHWEAFRINAMILSCIDRHWSGESCR